MRRHRHAKIVATVGPASAAPGKLRALFLAAVDTFRLNFSHALQDDHAKVHAALRALEKEVGRPIGDGYAVVALRRRHFGGERIRNRKPNVERASPLDPLKNTPPSRQVREKRAFRYSGKHQSLPKPARA